ncbi:hypothetical protein LCGC14_1051430 [marine sediment metagenome]|uniref:Uncharacterized protein n=1 Tax=marine sediment metagenome TaxID=412755 RepID=A0A0F9MT59_9ZZZZ
MGYTVHIKDTTTGEVRTRHYDKDWDDPDLANYFWWTEGNFSCDCNRGAEFDRAGGLPEKVEEGDWEPCNTGPNRYTLEKIVTDDGTEVPDIPMPPL